jgi:hypothetical protein
MQRRISLSGRPSARRFSTYTPGSPAPHSLDGTQNAGSIPSAAGGPPGWTSSHPLPVSSDPAPVSYCYVVSVQVLHLGHEGLPICGSVPRTRAAADKTPALKVKQRAAAVSHPGWMQGGPARHPGRQPASTGGLVTLEGFDAAAVLALLPVALLAAGHRPPCGIPP